MPTLHHVVLAQYDRMIGQELDEVTIHGCITKAPCGGALAGRSPVDRGTLGLKRSVAVDATGVPLGILAAEANCHDSPLLEPTVATLVRSGVDPAKTTIHLDRGYDNAGTQALLHELGFSGVISRSGVAAPIQAGTRWVVERTHAWMNAYGKLRRCTEKTRSMVELYLFLAAAIVVTQCLIRAARTR